MRKSLPPRAVPVESSLTPAQRITENLYQVFVPRIFMQTAEAAAFYGTMAQDNPMAQKEQEQGDMRVHLPATRLAELYAKGCKPWFLKPEESLKMYRDLTAYLQTAADNFNSNPNSNRFTPEMMEYLLALENYAHWLFGVAKPYFTVDDGEAAPGTMAAHRRFNPMARKSRDELLEDAKRREHHERDHVRVVDELVERQVARNHRGWK